MKLLTKSSWRNIHSKFLRSASHKKIICDFGIKVIKEQRKKHCLVPLVCRGWLLRIISKKVAADIIKAMSNLITSAVIVCNCAPDITPYTAANWLITWGYWTKLVASPSGRQSQTACPADCSRRFIQGIFFCSLTVDLQGAQLIAADQSKRRQQSPQKTQSQNAKLPTVM